MAWARGTCTDFMEMLRNLRDYADGTIDPGVHATINQGEQVPVGQRWTVLTNGAGMPNIPGSGFATDGEVYLQGPGSDPDDEIIVGVRTYRNAGANVWGWEMRGYTAFDDDLTFTTLAGVSPPAYAAFDDAPFDVWFWVNARRIMAAARIGTTDIIVHMGFIQQFGSRGQYPYPLLIAGSARDQTITFQTGNFGHSCLPEPCDLSCHLRWVDGTWQTFRNYTGTSSQRNTARTEIGNVTWPYRDSPDAPTGEGELTNRADEDLFYQFSPTNRQISPSLIDAHCMFPVVLFRSTAIAGRLDGMFGVFGLGMVAGDTLTDSSSSPAEVYDIFKNTWRSEPVDFIAIKRE